MSFLTQHLQKPREFCPSADSQLRAVVRGMTFKQLQTKCYSNEPRVPGTGTPMSEFCGETMGKMRGIVVSWRWEILERIRKLIKMPEKELN